MYRWLETIFQYPWRLLATLILLPIIGVGIAYFTVPHTYQATARLWAYLRFGVITATPTDNTLNETPAQTQSIALTELLDTRSFALRVARGIPIAPTLELSSDVLADPQKLDDAIFANISRNVVVTPLDYNLYTITYRSTSAAVAQQIVASVVNQFSLQGIQYADGNTQRLLQIYQGQLARAKQAAAQALEDERTYLGQHPELSKPGASPVNDPQYAALEAQRQSAQADVQNAENNITSITRQINAEGTNLEGFFKELDSPLVPDQPQSRTKQFLTAGGIGLGVGILACLVFLLILMRRDRAVYLSRDLEKLADLPIVMEIPQLPAKAMERLAEHSLRTARCV